jgi:CDP-diacylglycerol--serine O-phosphatidyltransferase
MNLKKTIFILPNLLTAAGLFCGMYAIVRCAAPDVTEEDVYGASLLILYAILFDMFDGRVARMTKTQTSFGIEFDSLADLVSFGVAPAVIAYRWALVDTGVVGVAACVVYVLAGAIRLARFNVLQRQPGKDSAKPGKYMLGLPIPMAAAFIVALVVATRAMGGWPWLTSHGFTVRGIGYPMLALVMLALALLMVSAVRFRSFKDLKINVFTVVLLTVVLGSSIFLWIKFKPAYILIWLLMLYVGIGFVEAIIFWPKRRRERRDKEREPLR